MRSFLSLMAALPLAVFAAPVPQHGDIIPGKWIVQVKSDAQVDEVLEEARGMRLSEPLNVGETFEVFDYKAFVVEGSENVADALSGLDGVVAYEPDRVVLASQSITQQANAPYGLARISTRQRGPTSYAYNARAGQNTDIYILDTGIRLTHRDFGGRARNGANFSPDNFIDDRLGHGTHVASSAGGTTFGVAKNANLINVKVLGGVRGSGSNSGIISGIQWALNDARNRNRIGRAVANLSLGGPASAQVNNAVNAAANNGLVMIVAAGNENQDARNVSPASASNVCTVASSNRIDARSDFSNFGPAVNIFAPGEDIIGAWFRSDTDSVTISGTSMASPHVAGLAAYLLDLEGPRGSVAICNRMVQIGTQGVISGVNGSPNVLAYNLARG